MDFYTNVCRTRDKILVKGYQNGKQVKQTVAYRPNHYVPSTKGETAFRSLDGRPLEAVNLSSMGGARKFRESYQGTVGFEIHGYDRYIYTYIADQFRGDIKWDFKTNSCNGEGQCNHNQTISFHGTYLWYRPLG